MTPIHGSHCEALGVSPDATAEEIHRAYRRLARRYHPDLNRGPEARARFDELSDAYAVLNDPQRRAGYDRGRVTPRSRTRLTPERQMRVPSFSRRPPRPVPRFIDEALPATSAWAAPDPIRRLEWWMPSPLNR